jgi:hypothetical protein
MNFIEFKTNDHALRKVTEKHGLEFSCHLGDKGLWCNIHNIAVLMLVYDGNSYSAFYDADYFTKGI